MIRYSPQNLWFSDISFVSLLTIGFVLDRWRCSAVLLFHRIRISFYRTPSNSVEYIVNVFSGLVVVSDVELLSVVDNYFLSLELISNLLTLGLVCRFILQTQSFDDLSPLRASVMYPRVYFPHGNGSSRRSFANGVLITKLPWIVSSYCAFVINIPSLQKWSTIFLKVISLCRLWLVVSTISW